MTPDENLIDPGVTVDATPPVPDPAPVDIVPMPPVDVPSGPMTITVQATPIMPIMQMDKDIAPNGFRICFENPQPDETAEIQKPRLKAGDYEAA